MDRSAPPAVVNIAAFPNGEIGAVWDDGHESYYAAHDLRCACPCAGCVDEMTGRKTLRDDSVPRDVRAVRITPVGRYAFNILWSDGHDTGIYSFETLRRLCPCARCSA